MFYRNYAFDVPYEKTVRVIVDTDAANEGDDQFAVIHALLCPKFDNRGFIAAHYGLRRHADSMERSCRELHRIFEAASCPYAGIIKHGAPGPLESETAPRPSDGSRLIIEESMKDDPRPLYVLFLGPLTDLASAYLEEPRISKRLTAIWIGGGAYPDGAPEFNLCNDINAANPVFSSDIELWQVPKDVYEMMPVSFAELQYRILGRNSIGDYLFKELMEAAKRARSSIFRTGETWVLGDSPAVGLVLYNERFDFSWVNAPRISASQQYIPSRNNRPIRVYRRIDSRLILEDMYAKIALFNPDKWQ